MLLLCLAPASACAQVHAQLGPAAILETDARFGAFGLAGDDQIGALLDARFLLTRGLDMGLQLGVRRMLEADAGETVLDGGADFRYALVEQSEAVPFDLSVGAGFGYTGGDDLTVLATALQGGVSRRLSTSNGRDITPYAGVVLTVAHTRVDVEGVESEFSDPDLDVALRLGLAAALSDGTALTGELQVKENPAFYLGLTTSF